MDIISNLSLGFATALSFDGLLYAFIGCLLGTLIGVLPGLGPLATISMLLPVTYGLDPINALIMLSGIYYGAQYGGSTTAILVNLPGESSSVVTALDGYQMARKGRAGGALTVAALGSFFAGCVGTLFIAAFAPTMAQLAFQFSPADYFSLMVLGVVFAVILASGSVLKAIGMMLLGLLIGLGGTDITSGAQRFTFGLPELADGIDFAVVAMGIFGVGEVIANLVGRTDRPDASVNRIDGLYMTRSEMKEAAPAVLRGTLLGSVLGILPGGGALLSSFASYAVEKRLTRNPKVKFGEGNIRGVAGPESANNAGSQTSFIPMLTLGIPSNAVMALMIGALMIQNIQPGPQIMTTNPQLFWGLIASMWVGNLMLVILNLPLVGLWVKLLTIPYRFLFPVILLLCTIGVFTIGNSVFDIWLLILFGGIGFLFRQLGCECAPLLLGMILGPMMEEYLRRALIMSRGDWTVFLTQPLSAGLLICAIALIALSLLPKINAKRAEAFVED